MAVKNLYCKYCKTEYELKNFYKCPSCSGIMEVDYDYKSLNPELLFRDKSDDGLCGIWKYKDLLPVKDKFHIVTLGEGNTPLIKANNLNQELEINNDIYLKLESTNPSGSFKDRSISVAFSKAKEFNIDTVIVASSGNGAAATSSYAARAGIHCVVCVPTSTDPNKVSQAVAHGAQVVYVDGNFTNAYNMAIQASETYGWMNVTTTFINPYTTEGNKTVSYELWEQMNKKVPDVIITPVGAGPLLVGMYKGFVELRKFNLIDKIPRLIGVQAETCAPIAEAYINGLEEVKGWKKEINTVATGIADPLIGYEDDGTLTLQAILASGGCVVMLNDEEIKEAKIMLSQKEGVFVEFTSATAIGAIKKLISEEKIKEEENIVCIITGHGLKNTNKYECEIQTVTKPEELIKIVNVKK